MTRPNGRADEGAYWDDVPVRAVVLDVDGTMYRQGPVRAAMLRRLVGAALVAPRSGVRALRVLRAYRTAQETIRHEARSVSASASLASLATRQLEHAARACGVSPAEAAVIVARWMEQAPLDLLAPNARAGLQGFVSRAAQRGLRIGVLSDYPADAKLRALGVREYVHVVRSAQDDDVQSFKPDPRGLLAVLRELGVSPSQAVYVGDREDVDGPTADSAGTRCALVTSRALPRPSSWRHVESFDALDRLLFAPRAG